MWLPFPFYNLYNNKKLHVGNSLLPSKELQKEKMHPTETTNADSSCTFWIFKKSVQEYFNFFAMHSSHCIWLVYYSIT